jgi:hypothetical protein
LHRLEETLFVCREINSSCKKTLKVVITEIVDAEDEPEVDSIENHDGADDWGWVLTSVLVEAFISSEQKCQG